ncbi:MAG: hypothetical protein EOP61_40600 [Sphingomonadales bacterium]|nr:MAG: hypothetical protein EOP61_40600 [Sphingomonadales bacterium]
MGIPGRRWVRWNKAMRQGFLDHLAATCNVKASAAVIGVDPCSVYTLRRRNPAFAAEWGEALELGYQMLETQLVGHALAGRGTSEAIEQDGIGPIDTHLALTMLTARRNARAGIAHKGGPKPRRATEADTNAALMKKLDAVEKRIRETGK